MRFHGFAKSGAVDAFCHGYAKFGAVPVLANARSYYEIANEMKYMMFAFSHIAYAFALCGRLGARVHACARAHNRPPALY
mmetsp:Transcript_58893/g.182936  ORF Transcript_58893/g.182936 Transcript_58893/m.182936 type:complete len:80 (+) Transcript_58893:144-383(+)